MTPKQVLGYYLVGKVKSITPISFGLIHRSLKVEAEKGTFLLQHLHPDLTHPSRTADYNVVTQFLKKKGQLTQTVVSTTSRKLQVKDGDSAWRLLTFVAGRVYDRAPTLTQAGKLGEALGQFHVTFKSFRSLFKKKKRLHDSARVYRTLLQLHKRYPSHPMGRQLATEIEFLKRHLPELFLPNTLPQRVIHGDPKITNIVFASKGRMVMVDLDTCQRDTPLFDLGDALRSWCKLDLRCFRPALVGYRSKASGFLSRNEQKYIVQAFQLITLQLAARFLIDVFENRFFGWDRQLYRSRRLHNIVRTRKMIAFYQTTQQHKVHLEHIVEEVFK